ncbi:Beta-glucosidase 12 [Linum perenne]
MRNIGMDAYRFSISWSRILPNGRVRGGVNRDGVNYYDNLINQLLANGIIPFVTLFHWDLPQTLEDEYGGFLSSKIVKDFDDYANVCFQLFGDRVKQWTTVNEAWTFSSFGYGNNGSFAPGRCSTWLNCSSGNSATEPYIVTHNILLAHASAVNLYRQKYQASQKGKIGIVLVSNWFVPMSDSKEDEEAQQRAIDFMYGWCMEPLSKGEYPLSMTSLVGKRLPKFTKQQSKMLKGSFDFIGINYYTANYASASACERSGVPIGPKGASSSTYSYPKGIREILLYTKNKYNNPLIYITENGNNETLSLNEALADETRVEYHRQHLAYLHMAINMDGSNVKGYFAWSLLDTFEWNSGYTKRYGINYVDYKNGLKRYPKNSSHWFRNFLNK